MISLIICSRTSALSNELYQNIDESIGCEYELITIDNSNNKYSIFEAYNLGIGKSSGSFLCFIHDDILFHTQNWGLILNNIFDKNPNIGLIGVAGAKIKTKMPSVWWDCLEDFKVLNLIQHLDADKKQFWNKGFQKSEEEVVVVDGVFLAAKRIDGIGFCKKLKGYHNYDLNLSFEYLKKGFKIVVTNKILIEHFSLGKLDKSWIISALKIHEIYSDFLPLTSLDVYEIKNQEFKNGSKFVNELLYYKMFREAIFLWSKLVRLKPKSKFHLEFIKKIKTACLP